jgi:hypothetical protein
MERLIFFGVLFSVVDIEIEIERQISVLQTASPIYINKYGTTDRSPRQYRIHGTCSVGISRTISPGKCRCPGLQSKELV